DRVRAGHPGPLVFVGKSMGGRVGCHLANELGENGPTALVCLGYPLVGQKGAMRDAVLLDLLTPILFVQGTRDSLCPSDRLAAVRASMSVKNELHLVEGGDHSLRVSARGLAARGSTQADVDEEVMRRIEEFIASILERSPDI
ncbi:MAG TPA: alpha/beta family hydrolase, partial [Polyangiaceae bacterium]